jgi:hypothetical protein
MIAFSIIYNLPLFYQIVIYLPAAKAGFRLLLNSIGISLGSLGYGLLMARTVLFIPFVADSRGTTIGLDYLLVPSRYLEVGYLPPSTGPRRLGNISFSSSQLVLATVGR